MKWLPLVSLLFIAHMTYGQQDNINSLLKAAVPGKISNYKGKGKYENTNVTFKYLGAVSNGPNVIKAVTYEKRTKTAMGNIHGSSGILFYNKKNITIGAYEMGGIDDRPDAIEGKNLVFRKTGDCNVTNKIDLSNGLPKSIYVRCTKDGGDLWNLTTEDKPFAL